MAVTKGRLSLLVKECLIDLLKEDLEVRSLVLESINNPLPPKPHVDYSEPKEKELWDKLVLLAEGRIKKVSHNGKRIVTPNKGIGFKSASMIKDWSSKAYTKLGARWEDLSDTKRNISESLLSNKSDSQKRERVIENDYIKEVISGFSTRDGESNVDISDIMMDTYKRGHSLLSEKAKTEQDSRAYNDDSIRMDPSVDDPIVGGGTNWATLAFFDKK